MAIKRRFGPAVARARVRWLIFGAGVLVLVAAGWIAGFFWFVGQIPDSLEDANTRTDAIVVLTGAAGRLDEGLDLIERNMADELFVSGVYRGVDVSRLLEASRSNPQDLDCCIVLGHAADDTEGNAQETAEWMRQRAYRSLRVVTSSYHLPRSLLEFRRTLPGVTIVPHPVFAGSFKRDRWWAWPGTTSLIVSEFNKYLLAQFRHAVEDAFGLLVPGRK